jgi:uncharacterized protein YecE (DUF72 family)
MNSKTAAYYVGCSGYYYPQWKNIFYPLKMAQKDWLSYYSSVFNTLELNGSFYSIPKPASLKKYYQATPDNFRFSVKANKYFTHILRLKHCKDKIVEFEKLISDGLETKLACILFQFPPSFHYTPSNLDLILENIKPSCGNVIELRHVSWWKEEVRVALKEHSLSFCSVDYPGLPNELQRTTSLFYLRLHGTPELFKSDYNSCRLKAFYEQIPKGSGENYIYFNNTYYDAAFRNARELICMFPESNKNTPERMTCFGKRGTAQQQKIHFNG